ncbi:MAG: hypothetical protein GTO17_02865 [Candidatus Aminicenantes bacterium]|nr:hypothetical protein [Candidatus Aminicenantes bacterium]
MHLHKRIMLGINVLGGTAVISSYVYGFLTNPTDSGSLWGGIPDSMKPFYVTSMFMAAAGYFLYSYFLLFRANPNVIRVARWFGFSIFNMIYVLILFPSALWMPLTFKMIAAPNPLLSIAIRLILWCIGLFSLILVIALLCLRPRKPAIAYWLAVVGSIVFFVQTGILDAIIWVIHFPA